MENPFEYISKPKVHSREEAYTLEEAEAILAGAEPWFAKVIEFDLCTAVRPNELIKLDRVNDVDHEAQEIRVTGKGNKRASIPVIPRAAAILNSCAPQ